MILASVRIPRRIKENRISHKRAYSLRSLVITEEIKTEKLAASGKKPPVFCRAAGNRTRSLRTRSARTTGILRPELRSEFYTILEKIPPRYLSFQIYNLGVFSNIITV